MKGYNIKTNDYVKPIEPRKEVVQRLINYFITAKDTCRNEFCANECWRRTYGLQEHEYRSHWEDELWSDTSYTVGEKYRNQVRVTTADMKEFVRVWIKAGYFVSRGLYSVNRQTAILYKFTGKPFTDYGFRVVNEFTEDID